MKNRQYIYLTVILLIFFLLNCAGGYKVDIDPPKKGSIFSDVFPEKITDYERYIRTIDTTSDVIGYEALYGNNDITIRVIHFINKERSSKYFKDKIIPEFKKLKRHFKGKKKGNHLIKGLGKDGSRWYGWQNNEWIYIISGKDKEHFNYVVNNFKYIEKK